MEHRHISSSNDPCAEIIESGLHYWVAQCWKRDHAPAFGSLVTITEHERIHLGFVFAIQTRPSDSSRIPFTYQRTQEQLQQEQPQIFAFLHTVFSCLPIGYIEEGKLLCGTAPHPPRIHAFVAPTHHDVIPRLFKDTLYLHTLLNPQAGLINSDELLLAIFRQYKYHFIEKDKMDAFMHTYALLVGNDYRRIKLFFRRLEAILGTN